MLSRPAVVVALARKAAMKAAKREVGEEMKRLRRSELTQHHIVFAAVSKRLPQSLQVARELFSVCFFCILPEAEGTSLFFNYVNLQRGS